MMLFAFIVSFVFTWGIVSFFGILLSDPRSTEGELLRVALWPITLVLLVPLGVWLCIKLIWRYLAAVGSVYKEKM